MSGQSEYDIVFTDAAIVTMDPDRRILTSGTLAVQGNRIAAVQSGEAEDLTARADRVIDAAGRVLIPGLVNAHSHLAMTLFRGFVEDLLLHSWLEKVWKYELSMLDAAAVRAGSALAFAELVRSGVTCVHDMYWHYMETIDLAEEIGFRLVSGPSFTTLGDFDFQEMLQRGRRELEQLQSYSYVEPVVQAHSTYTTSQEMMHRVCDLKHEYNVPFTTHASENQREVDEVRSQFGKTPIELLEEYRLLDDRTVLAHCVVLDDHEISMLADSGTHVAHCPESNLKLGSGIARIAEMQDAGVSLCIGTDGPASNNDLDLLGELRTAALLQKGFQRNPQVFTTAQAMEMVTINGARAYGMDHLTGSLEVGKRADIVMLDFNSSRLTPLHDICAHLVYSVSSSDVEMVLIDGKSMLENGELTFMDEQKVRADVRAVASRFV